MNREEIEAAIKARVELIDAAYRERLERAIERGWHLERQRLFTLRQRDIDRETRELIKLYAKLPIPPVVLGPIQ